MNQHQRTALTEHCRLAFETARPRYRYVTQDGRCSIVLTTNTGYE